MLLLAVGATLLLLPGQWFGLPVSSSQDEDGIEGTELEPPAAMLQTGAWRACLESPGGELPFGLEIAREGASLSATIVNGEERIPVPVTRVEGAEIVLEMPHYDSAIRARVAPLGTRLEGEWRKRSGADRWTTLPFRALEGAAPRFTPHGRKAAAIEGRYSADFGKEDEPAVLILRRSASGESAVEGTFLTSTGDYRWLAGSLEGDRLRLSCFDGAHAFLFDATVGVDGRIAGDFWSGDRFHDAWTAAPDENAAIADEFERARWKEGFGLALLLYPDLDGRERCLAEPSFAGRATILQVLGTWCPNCHDETAYLARLHERYKDRGLSIVGLAFEMTGDFGRSAGQVRQMQVRHGVKYPILLAGLADKGKAAEALPALDRVFAFPTTVFLHRDGRVHAIHSGFAGPATKEEHAKLTQRFEAIVEELLAEPDADDEETWRALAARTWHSSDRSILTFRRGPSGDRVFDSVSDSKDCRMECQVEVRGASVLLEGAPWHFDREGRVLLDPRDFGRRIVRDLAAGASSELVSPAAWERREAIVSMVRLVGAGRWRAAFDPTPLLSDPDVLVRTTAAWAAGEIGAERAGAAVLDCAKHGYAPLRREAARAIGAMRLQEGIPALTELLTDLDPLVRQAAEEALSRLGPR